MLKANLFSKQGKYTEANELYQRVIEFHPKDITADDALFKQAELNENIFMDSTKAMSLYEKLIVEYPGSLYVVEARKRFRSLRGDS
jgi:TolA-binding protein